VHSSRANAAVRVDNTASPLPPALTPDVLLQTQLQSQQSQELRSPLGLGVVDRKIAGGGASHE